MGIEYRRLEQSIVQDAFIERWVRRVYELPDGRTKEMFAREGRGGVIILALTDDEQVVLLRQFRIGPEKVMLDLPSGVLEEGEAPQAAAERELREETGYAGTVRFLKKSHVDAYSSSLRYHFVATGCRRVGDPHPDANEFVEVTLMPLDAFRRAVLGGEDLCAIDTALLGLHALGRL